MLGTLPHTEAKRQPVRTLSGGGLYVPWELLVLTLRIGPLGQSEQLPGLGTWVTGGWRCHLRAGNLLEGT